MRPTLPVALAILGSVALAAGYYSRQNSAERTAGSASSPSQALVLQESEGERRVRRLPPQSLSTLRAPFIIKVDRQNGGSPDFVMLYEDIPPGEAITPHLHPNHDEILFVHQGSGIATLGSRQADVTAGATIYIPSKTRVTLRNSGTGPLSIVALFARPGFEDYLREISVPEGKEATPLSVEELSAIRSRHRDHVVYDRP